EKLYHGCRAHLQSGDEIQAQDGFAYCTPSLDAAIWAAELAEGEEEPRAYQVAATGSIQNAQNEPGYVDPPQPHMSWRSPQPLTVQSEVTERSHYPGTRAEVRAGDLIAPGYAANFGSAPR